MPTQVTLRISPQDAAQTHVVKKHLAQALKIDENQINAYQILRQSIDARSRNIVMQLQINVFVGEPFEDAFHFDAPLQNVANAKPVLIAGAGPASLFAALRLIEAGLKPIILERGVSM